MTAEEITVQGSGRRRTKSFPVTVTQMPTVRCEVCRKTIPHRPGQAADTLTQHYLTAHPNKLG